jgi:AcrR family transcriptional regulator
MDRPTQRLSAAQRRRVILDSALPLFAKSGYRGTTTASIAKAAGVTEPILYRHFKSKLDLFNVLLLEISGKAASEWKDMTAGVASPLERLGLIARSFPALGRKFEDDFRIMLAGLTEVEDPVTKTVLRKHYEFYAGFIADILAELPAFKSGGLDPGYAAFHLVHMAVGFALMDQIEIPATAEEEYVQHAVGFIGKAIGG